MLCAKRNIIDMWSGRIFDRAFLHFYYIKVYKHGFSEANKTLESFFKISKHNCETDVLKINRSCVFSGKRRCMGENLARNSLFLYFAAFMQAFDIGVPDGSPLPNIRPNDGITLQPKPFEIQLTPRF